MCVLWFSFECFCRFQSSRHKTEYFSNFLNVIDLLAAVPYWLELPIVLLCQDSPVKNEILLSLLQFLRLTRVFRVLKIARY